MANKNLVILQARMSSTRLPGKVLAIINGQPMILWQIQRIKEARSIDELIVATSTDQSDDALVEFLELNGVLVHRGPIDDVYERFRQVLKRLANSQTIVRLTADCPFTMPELIDEMVNKFESSDIDYLSNALVPTFPDGLDVEIFTRVAFTKLLELQLSPQEIEHVTLGFYQRQGEFRISNFMDSLDRSDLRWTVDYSEDLSFVRSVYSHFKGQETSFGYEDALQFLGANPQIISEVSASRRNEALLKPTERHN